MDKKRDRSYAFSYSPVLARQVNDFLNDKNPIYKAVENLFLDLGLDKENYGKEWNPLGMIIKPGNKVVIKPNFVSARDREHRLSEKELLSTSTSPAVLKPIIDYAWKSLRGEGKIYIVDSPIEGSNFEETLDRLGMSKLIEMLQKKGVNIEILDLRDFTLVRKMFLDDFILGDYSLNLGFLFKKSKNGDPRGYKLIDLKQQSFLSVKGWDYQGFCFPRTHSKIPAEYHNFSKNIYSISKTVLESDVFINVPKLKTHKKTGVTLSLKNLIGITNRKYWLPHYREGTPPEGDEYPQKPPLAKLIQQKLARFPLPLDRSLIMNFVDLKDSKNYITEGDWCGNDTLWRVILDFNKILFFSDKAGKMKNKIQRKYLTIIDGIIGGEGSGPLRPTPRAVGFLIAGFNPAIVDCLATNVMGFDYHRIKQLERALDLFGIKTEELDAVLDDFNKRYKINLKFQPPFGWKNIVRK